MSNPDGTPKVLVIEDSDAKFAAITSVLNDVAPDAEIIWAPTMIDAEKRIGEDQWDLVILDISMDIAPSSLGPRSRGQANIGGLGIAQRMFLLDQEAPTIIVTAFDSFSAPATAHGAAEIMGFEEIKARAQQYLPNSLVACLQYNNATWKSEMRDHVLGVLSK